MAILVKRTLRATLKSSSGDGLVLRSPALAHHEVCFGQMGKVGRSSRATIVNETFGLWLASGSGGGYRVSFCSDRRPFPRDGGDHVWSGVAQPASRRCPGTHDYGTRSSMDSRLLRRIRGTLLCLAASAPCVWHDHDLEHVPGEPSEAKFELVKVCWRRMAGRRRSFAIPCESP